MKLICIHIPETHLKDLDSLIETGFYKSRAEIIRSAVIDLLKNEVWPKEPAS